MRSTLLTALAVLLAASFAQASIIDWYCDDDGDGAIVMNDEKTWEELGPAEYRLDMAGVQKWFPAHVEGEFTADSEEDPTVWLVQTIENQTDFVWTGYQIKIGMNKPFSIDSVIGPLDWTWNVVQPVAGDIPNDGGPGYVGYVDFVAGTPIQIGGSGNFGLVFSFLGGVEFCTEQIPTPEPTSLLLLGLGGLGLMRRRSR